MNSTHVQELEQWSERLDFRTINRTAKAKVDIIRKMSPLDPEGDWDRRGAQALENPRTTTGEESLERLYALLEDLNRGGVQSEAFKVLRNKIFQRHDSDSHSET